MALEPRDRSCRGSARGGTKVRGCRAIRRRAAVRGRPSPALAAVPRLACSSHASSTECVNTATSPSRRTWVSDVRHPTSRRPSCLTPCSHETGTSCRDDGRWQAHRGIRASGFLLGAKHQRTRQFLGHMACARNHDLATGRARSTDSSPGRFLAGRCQRAEVNGGRCSCTPSQRPSSCRHGSCTAARWPHPARRVRPTAVRTRVITNLCSRLPHHSLRRPGLRPAKHGRPVGGPARPLTGAGSAQSMDERSLARGRCTHRCPS
jgi:hypothetical protein